MSEGDFLEDFVVEGFEDTLSELEEEFGAVEGVSFGSEEGDEELGFFMVFGVLFPGASKAEELAINLKGVVIIFPELDSKEKYIKVDKKAVEIKEILGRMFIGVIGLGEVREDLDEGADEVVEGELEEFGFGGQFGQVGEGQLLEGLEIVRVGHFYCG